jgi:hypothetical protein
MITAIDFLADIESVYGETIESQIGDEYEILSAELDFREDSIDDIKIRVFNYKLQCYVLYLQKDGDVRVSGPAPF